MSGSPGTEFARTNRPTRAAGTEKLQFKIGGLSCSFCVASITKALGRMDGVREATVNLAHEEALVEYEPAKVMRRFHRQLARYRKHCGEALAEGESCPVIVEVSRSRESEKSSKKA